MLSAAIQSAADQCVPKTRPSPFTKRWWTKELSELRRQKKKLRAKSYRLRAQRYHPVHEQATKASDEYAKSLEATKRKHWDDWLEEVDANNIWTAHRYAGASPTDGGVARIPTLKRLVGDQVTEIDTNEEKSKLLYETFFPRSCNRTNAEASPDYPDPVCEFSPITDKQMTRTIRKLSPYKAPGLNGICNIVFIKNADILVPWMGHLFRATFSLNYFPESWLISKTVVIRKPGRPDYGLPKAYRPIALLDTMSKILSACVAEDIVWIASTYKLLPDTHFGGLPGKSVVDSIHLLTKFIHDAWAHPTDNHVSILFMDVKAAFPSVVPERLFHNMRMRGLPAEYISWYKTRLTGRSTTLEFDDFCSTLFNIDTGIDQGCPLSVVGFLFYNADILDIPNKKKGELGAGFIDDIKFMARGPTFEAANMKLANIVERPGGCFEWSTTHQVEFEIDKTALVQASRRRQKSPTNPRKTVPTARVPIKIAGRLIKPVSSHKFLGVIIDEQLRFKEQMAAAAAKGTKYALACRRLAKPSLGIRQKHMKRLYDSVVVPKMFYAVDVWGAEMVSRLGSRAGRKGNGRILDKVLRMHALTTTGAMRTTATDAAVAHANLTPTPFLLRKLCFQAYARMTTLPSSNPIHKEVRSANRHCKRHKSPLHHLALTFLLHPKDTEEITAPCHSPKWNPNVAIVIDGVKEEAVERANKAQEEVQIFTDGSGFNNGIGAAAILRRPGKADKILRFHLGSAKEHTVYNGEQVGMVLGAELLRREGYLHSAYMGVDNQAAIQAVLSRDSRSGHTLTDMFLQVLQQATDKHQLEDFQIQWVPGHAQIAGNEAVDAEAKRAAEGETSPANLLPPELRKGRSPATPICLPFNKAALKQAHNDKLKKDIMDDFMLSARGARLRCIDPSLPSNKFTALVDSLPRRHTSALVQLRTGHTPLNHHLARIGKVPSPACARCGAAYKTVHHYVLMCPAYQKERSILRWKVGSRKMNLSSLLTERSALKELLRYLARTQRFTQVFGDLTPPPPPAPPT